jgi:hypothetical protein
MTECWLADPRARPTFDELRQRLYIIDPHIDDDYIIAENQAHYINTSIKTPLCEQPSLESICEQPSLESICEQPSLESIAETIEHIPVFEENVANMTIVQQAC